MRQMTVFGISLDVSSGLPVVILRDSSNTFLPIWVGHPEAASIIAALQGLEPARPLTHDLVTRMVSELGAQLVSVAIVDVQESTFYASLTLVRDGLEFDVDSRPSDAIALALRAGAPIYAAEEVLLGAGGQVEVAGEEQTVEEFRHFLDQVSPEDFGHTN